MELASTVLAVLAAPVIAVWVGQQLQNRRIQYDRRYSVFAVLMRERFSFVAPAAVGALNLIDVEFKGDPKVLESWRKYFQLLKSSEFAKMDGNTQNETSKPFRAQLLLDMIGAMKFKERFTLEDLERGYLPLAITGPQEVGAMVTAAIRTAVQNYGAIPVVVLGVQNAPPAAGQPEKTPQLEEPEPRADPKPAP
jgi:hypothetical protein